MSTKQPIWPSGRFGVPQITPFTYRDGHTHLELIEALRDHLVEHLHPSLVETVNSLVEQMEAEYGKALDQYVNGVDEFQRIHDAFMSDVNAHLIALNDGAVSDLVDDPSSLLRSVLSKVFVSHVETNQHKIVATDPRYGEPYTLQSIYNALDHAEELGLGTIVEFPSGIYDVESGLDLSGYSAQLRGNGATGSTTQNHVNAGSTSYAPGGTTFYASTQNGPVLDFTNWVYPPQFLGKAVHSGFRVRGSEVVDPTKKNVGMRFALIMSTVFRDIAIEDTGGAGIYGSDDTPGRCVYICDFENVVIKTPVGAYEFDIPYAHFHGANGNRFRSLGIRSITHEKNLGQSGAVIFEGDGEYRTSYNHIDSPWVEYMKIPSDSTIFRFTDGIGNHISDPYIVDVSEEPDSTNSSYFMFDHTDLFQGQHGGNQLSGRINGAYREGNYGVKLLQPRNRVTGVKGYPGRNVFIGEGAFGNTIELGAAESGSTDPAVVDHSGDNTNTVIDHYTGEIDYGVRPRLNTYRHRVNGRVLAAPTPYIVASENTVLDCSETETFEIMFREPGGTIDLSLVNAADGTFVTLLLRQSASTTQVNWNTTIRWVGGTPPTLNAVSGQHDTIVLKYTQNGGWFEISRAIS